MNKREHIINAVLVGVGVGLLLAPPADGFQVDQVWGTWRSIIGVAVPVILGALVPDIDVEFGRHRKTLHNALILGGFVAFPFVFDNLNYVWIGVLTHYVLDMLGSRRGIAVFYPFSADEWNPLKGVTVSSKFAGAATFLISLCELAVATILILGSAQAGVALPL